MFKTYSTLFFLFKRSGKGALLSLKDTRAQNLIEFIHTSNKICCIQVLQSAIQWIASILTMKSVTSKYCKFQLNELHPYNQWNLLHPRLASFNSMDCIHTTNEICYIQVLQFATLSIQSNKIKLTIIVVKIEAVRNYKIVNELEWSWMSTDSDWS